MIVFFNYPLGWAPGVYIVIMIVFKLPTRLGSRSVYSNNDCFLNYPLGWAPGVYIVIMIVF